MAETQQTAEDRVASARSGGRRPLPVSGCGAANLEPMKGQISRPSSAQGQSGEPGTPASTRKSLPAGGPLGHGRQLPAGAAHAAATAMASISGQDEGGVLPLKADHGQERPPDSPRQKPDVERIPWAADSAVSTAASSGANVKHKDLKAHEKGDKNGKSDARTSERTDISCTHGPGAEGDPVGVLLGAENLPMVGAAGVLVLPRRQAEKAPEKVPEKSRKKAQVDFTDLVALLADEELDGWGGAEEPAWQLFERRKEQQNFHRYVEDSVASCGADAEPELDMEQVRTLTLDQPAAKPSQGPGIRQLAQEPARREECPVCQAEWIVALRCMQEGKPPPEKEALALQPVKKQPNSAKKYQKMHSIQCNWAWFQQNLCSMLCSLRFDKSTAAPRPSPPSPSSVLPPPMPDVVQYWKKAGKSRGRDPGSPKNEGRELAG